MDKNSEKILDISTYNYYTSHYNAKKDCDKINHDVLRISKMLEYQYGSYNFV